MTQLGETTQPMNTTPISLQAANMILQGATCETVAAYLDDIISGSMALGPPSEAVHRASLLTAEAISAYLQVDRASF
ncbi:hypothetical protein LZK75_06130 [Rhizobium leguminosarum]|nr:hypothetical protein LZK75_06130 [Rhizobium leguminosarum]